MRTSNAAPDVSVLIPLHNKEDFIRRTIESCLENQIQNIEVVVVDDCSTDTSLDKVRHFGITDNRVRVVKNEKNLGLYGTRLRLLEEARGEFVLYLDADDTLVPNCLQHLLMVARNDNVPVVKGWAYTDNGKQVFLGHVECRHRRDLRRGQFASEKTLWYHLGSVSLYFYNREFLKSVDLPRDIAFMGEDTALNSCALSKASAISLVRHPIYTLNRTYESGSAEAVRLDRYHEIVGNQLIAKKNLRAFPLASAHLLQAQLRRRVGELKLAVAAYSYDECEPLIRAYKTLYSDIDILRYRPGNEYVDNFPDALPQQLDRQVAILLRYGSPRDLYMFLHDQSDPSAKMVISRIEQAWTHLSSIDLPVVSLKKQACSVHGMDFGACAAEFAALAKDETPELSAGVCDLTKLKALLVRLRRHDRDKEAWEQFQHLLQKNLGVVASALNTRWLLSIAETFADYGTDKERHAAIMISMIVNMEKTYRTLDLVYSRTRTPVPRGSNVKFEPDENGLHELWDGVTIVAGSENDDYLINVFRRVGRELSGAPILSTISAAILERLFEESDSSFALMDQFLLRFSLRNELIDSVQHAEHRQATEDNLIIGYLNREVRALRAQVKELQGAG